MSVMVKPTAEDDDDLSFNVQSLKIKEQAVGPVFAGFQPGQIFDVFAGARIEIPINASHPENKPITIQAFNLPRGATYNQIDGEFIWDTQADSQGQYTVVFVATDSDNLYTLLTANITVLASGAGFDAGIVGRNYCSSAANGSWVWLSNARECGHCDAMVSSGFDPAVTPPSPRRFPQETLTLPG